MSLYCEMSAAAVSCHKGLVSFLAWRSDILVFGVHKRKTWSNQTIEPLL
jgi:hypothetical protein